MKKVCTKCEIEKELGEFHKNKSGKYGVRSYCKACSKEYYKEYRKQNKDKIKEKKKEYYEQNKDKIKENIKEYREQNKDKIKEKKKEYYEQNKDKIKEKKKEYREQNEDKIKEKKKEYYEQNKDKIKEYQKEYREQNKDKIKENMKEYREQNKDKISEYQKKYYQSERGRMVYKINNHKRRAKKKEIAKLGTYTIEEWQEAMQFFNNKCAWSGKVLTDKNESTDHINPINKGGTNNINNVVPCDKSVNSSKRDNNWEEWYPKQPFYSKEREKKIREWIELKTAISLFD